MKEVDIEKQSCGSGELLYVAVWTKRSGRFSHRLLNRVVLIPSIQRISGVKSAGLFSPSCQRGSTSDDATSRDTMQGGLRSG